MLQKNKTIPKILERYLDYLIAIKGCSVNTITAFSSDLMQFFSFIEKYKNIPVHIKDFTVFILSQVKESDIIAFLVYLNYSKDNSPYTRQRKITALKSFYKWLFSVFAATNNKKNPTFGLSSIKKVERLPKYLTLTQAKQIQNVFNLSNTRFPERNNAIISLFLSTGIRLSELININLGDIDFENNSVVIFGKNNKERIAYFSNYCKKELLLYIDSRNHDKTNLKADSPLFLNRLGKRIGVEAVENVCKKAYKLIGLENNGYTTHTLRHTAATIMYTYVKNDILLLKEFLGHSSLASTQIYTHLSNDKIREAVDKNPLNTFKREGSIWN